MPICNKSAIPVGGRKGATEIDDHASEAAKLKRAREQAYFNSYNFDAIEVLHSENEVSEPEDADDGKKQKEQKTTKTNRTKTLIKYQRTANKSQPPPTSQPAASVEKNENIVAIAESDNNNNKSSNNSNSSNINNENVPSMKYAYLQRLGAFFVSAQQQLKPPPPTPPATSVTTTTTTTATPTKTTAIAAATARMTDNMQNAKEAKADSNFLLPRAMLKYQSGDNSNSSSVGASNSMPLTIVTTHEQQQQQWPTSQQQQKMQLQLHGIGGSITQNDNKTTAAVMANTALSLISLQNSTTQSYSGHEDGQTSFLMLQKNFIAKKTKTVPRNKKSSTTSTATTVTTTTTNGNLELPNSVAIVAATTVNATTNDSSGSSGSSGSSSSNESNNNVRNSNLVSSKQKIITTLNGNKYKASHRSSNASTESHDGATATHGRAHSHQSHYSTDKSGSSGYYSSNVCSTYSIEDHIYCEPVIDIVDLNGKQKSKSGKTEIETARRLQQPLQQLPPLSGTAAAVNLSGKVLSADTRFDSQTRTMSNIGRNGSDDTDTDGDEEESDGKVVATRVRKMQQHRLTPQKFNEKLRVLETSIDNLDRHLKNFSSLSSQEHIVSYVQTSHQHQPYLPHEQGVEKLRLTYNHHLPTIMEGYDPVNQPCPWQHEITDDSLLDIDLDSFLLTNETKDSKRKIAASTVGIDNPTFITDEVEENNYKCAKYINSCPENAYRVESDIVGTESHGTASQKSLSAEHFLRCYEDQLHFQNTRELLEDVRDKIRILSQSNSDIRTSESSEAGCSDRSSLSTQSTDEKPTTHRQHFNSIEPEEVPKELENMIKTLKSELESYLDRMNQTSEYEIRQLCSGLVKNDYIVKMKRAFERRRSITEQDFYEAIANGENVNAVISFKAGVPKNIRQQIASIRCASDPNFKMKRKSLCDVFPTVNCFMETANEQRRLESSAHAINRNPPTSQTQLQRNLSYHKPVLNQLEPIVLMNGDFKKTENIENHTSKVDGAISNGGNSTGESGGDKDSILDWHRKKPSIWEQYYGTNRMHQSLLGKRNGMVINHNNQSTMSYPSSRPESDFTLDLPRAEQLRIKMEKEKKFRQRCRFITTILSLVFFLLTVMVVSLVLTRGKRMFGSMI